MISFSWGVPPLHLYDYCSIRIPVVQYRHRKKETRMIVFGGLVHNWFFGLLCTIFYCLGLVHKWWFRMLCTKMFIEADRIFVK